MAFLGKFTRFVTQVALVLSMYLPIQCIVG